MITDTPTKTTPAFSVTHTLTPSGSQTAVTALYDGEMFHTDTFNLGKASAREKFAKATAKKILAMGQVPDADQIEAALMRAHAEAVGNSKAATDAEQDDEARPTIQSNGRQLDEVTIDAMQAVWGANDPPWLFQAAAAN